MKKSIIKITFAFMILLFCLVPLSAADLNADNGTNIINPDDNDCISVDDVKITDVDEKASYSDNEIEITDDLVKASDSDNETKILDVNSTDSNSTDKTLDKDNDQFHVTAADIVEGESAVIEVHARESLNSKVYVNCNSHPYLLYVENGFGSITVDGLKAGTYTVTALDQRNSLSNSTTFTVKSKEDSLENLDGFDKNASDSDNETKILDVNSTDSNSTNETLDKDNDLFYITADDITAGESAIIKVHANESVNCGVYIDCNGHFTFLRLKNGFGSITLDGLKAGTYTVRALVQRVGISNSTTFTVKPKPNPLEILDVFDSDPGAGVYAVVTVNSNYTGVVTVKVDGSSQTKKAVFLKGRAIAFLDVDLTPGNHTLVATASETDKFGESQMTATFTVSRTPYIGLEVSELSQGEDLVVKISTTKYYDGSAFFYNDDMYCSGYVVDGEFVGIVKTDNMTAGEHKITAVIRGNDEYFDSVLETTFYIKEKGTD